MSIILHNSISGEDFKWLILIQKTKYQDGNFNLINLTTDELAYVSCVSVFNLHKLFLTSKVTVLYLVPVMFPRRLVTFLTVQEDPCEMFPGGDHLTNAKAHLMSGRCQAIDKFPPLVKHKPCHATWPCLRVRLK